MKNSLLLKMNDYLHEAEIHTGIRVFITDIHRELISKKNVKFVFVAENYATFKRYVYSYYTDFAIFIDVDESRKFCRAEYIEHDGPKFRHVDKSAMNKFMDKLKEEDEVTIVLGFYASDSRRYRRLYQRDLREYSPEVVRKMAEYDEQQRNMMSQNSHSFSSSSEPDVNDSFWNEIEDDLTAYREKDDAITESLMTHIVEGSVKVNGKEVEFKNGIIQEHDAMAKSSRISPEYRKEVNQLVEEVSKLFGEQRLRFLIDKAIDEGDRESFLNYSQELAEYKVANNRAFE
jgi:hypothetical protein